MNLLEFSWLNLIVCRFWCIVLGLYVWKGLRFNSYLFARMMSIGKFFIVNVLNQLNACKICLELWTFIIYITCIGGNFSALCMKSAKAGQTIYLVIHDSEFRICDRLTCGYVWSQVFAVQTECFWAFSFNCFVVIVCVFVCFFFSFFSLLFAVALVANKVIILRVPRWKSQIADFVMESTSCFIPSASSYKSLSLTLFLSHSRLPSLPLSPSILLLLYYFSLQTQKPTFSTNPSNHRYLNQMDYSTVFLF